MKRYGGLAYAIAILVSAAAFFPGEGHAQNKSAECKKVDVVGIQIYPGQIHNLVAWVVVQEGLLKKRCLEGKLMSFASGPAAVAASLQGGLQYMHGSPENIYIAASQGADLKMVAWNNPSMWYALVVGKHVPLPNLKNGYPAVMKDLVGKKVGVNGFGSSSDGLSRYSFTAAGIDTKAVTWVAYGQLAFGIAALQNGTLDVIATFADGMETAAAASGGTIVADFRDPRTTKSMPIQIRGTHMVWSAQTAYLKEDPDRARRFFEANNEAIDWMKDPKNYKAILDIVREKAPSPPGIADPEKLLEVRVRSYVNSLDKHTSRRGLQSWNDWAVAMNRLPKPAHIDSLLWETARSMLRP